MRPQEQITLVIDNPEQLLHGCTPSRQFDPAGGSIGSAGCDWILNDRQQRVHPLHCELRLVEGRFCVIDQCGQTRLNGHELALGMATAARLNNGDRLHIGAYTVIVHLHSADLTSLSHQQTVNDLLGHSESPLDALLKGFIAPEDKSPSADRTPKDLLTLIRQPQPHETCDPLRALELTQAPVPTTQILDLFGPQAQPQRCASIGQSVSAKAANRSDDQNHWSRSDDTGSRLPQRSNSGAYSMATRVLMLLTACFLLAGCTMLGKLGQVIIDPSTPVGTPNQQPTRITLSLYATRSVNPNPLGMLEVPDTTLSESPAAYGATVSARNQSELTDKLQALLEHLQSNTPMQSLQLEALNNEPVMPMSPVEPSGVAAYNDPMVTLTLPDSTPTPEQLATPIAFKILQLKDDSLLRNATSRTLADDLKQALGSTYIKEDDYLLKPGEFKFINDQSLDEATRYLAVIARYHDTTRDTTQWKQTLRVEPIGHTYALLVHLDEAQVELKAEQP